LIAYINLSYLNKKEIIINPEDRGFNFGDGAYEVIKTYHNVMFEFDAHLDRLKQSLNGLEIAFNRYDDIETICRTLLKKNQLEEEEASIYIQVTRGVAARKHAYPAKSVEPTLFIMVKPCPSTAKEQAEGVKILIEPDIRWARCNIKSISLIPNVMATEKANQNGAFETVFVRDGCITEGASSNFFALIDGILHTYPESNYILSGITRRVMIRICSTLNIEVKEVPVRESELDQATEMFVISTINEIIPVVQYGDKQVGEGRPGPVARRIQAAFADITQNQPAGSG
jgi:D-alanine transaminase